MQKFGSSGKLNKICRKTNVLKQLKVVILSIQLVHKPIQICLQYHFILKAEIQTFNQDKNQVRLIIAQTVKIIFLPIQHPAPMPKKPQPQPQYLCAQSRPSLCHRYPPVIQHIIRDVKNLKDLDTATKQEYFDELELLLAQNSQKCECNTAMKIVCEAANLKRWMKLLFSHHENTFHKYEVKVPVQYTQLRNQIMELIGHLEQKMMIQICENPCDWNNEGQRTDKHATKKIKKSTRNFTPKLESEELRYAAYFSDILKKQQDLLVKRQMES